MPGPAAGRWIVPYDPYKTPGDGYDKFIPHLREFYRFGGELLPTGLDEARAARNYCLNK